VFQPIGVLSQYIFGSLLFFLSLFIIGIILLQRGKGGGLTGALGGMGGQSAFGVKAGDLFTRITAIAVLLWIFFCALACRWYRPEKLDIEADASSSMSIGAGPAELGGTSPSPETGLQPSPIGTEGEPIAPSQPNNQP
jgi:preprotein translocase subunit SecG